MCYSLTIVCSTAFDGVDVYGILCVKMNYSISHFFCYFPKHYCFVWGILAST